MPVFTAGTCRHCRGNTTVLPGRPVHIVSNSLLAAALARHARVGIVVPAALARHARVGIVAPAGLARHARVGIVAPAGLARHARIGVVTPLSLNTHRPWDSSAEKLWEYTIQQHYLGFPQCGGGVREHT